jgi:thymidine kinase
MNNIIYMPIHTIIGPMFSGKTTHIIAEYNNMRKQYCSDDILVINHAFDTRYSENTLCSHDNNSNILCKMIDDINIITTEFIHKNGYNVILINEGQFFNGISNWLRNIASKFPNIHVYICGLDGDYKQKPFYDFLDIIPLSDTVIKLCGKCRCGNPAPFTMRNVNNDSQILVGNDIYSCVCKSCLNH